MWKSLLIASLGPHRCLKNAPPPSAPVWSFIVNSEPYDPKETAVPALDTAGGGDEREASKPGLRLGFRYK